MMTKWFSIMLSVVLVFTILPTAFAQGNGQAFAEKKAEPYFSKKEREKKVTGKVTNVDVTTGNVTLDSKGKIVQLMLTAKTKIKIAGMKEVTLTDIWVGDNAIVEYSSKNNVNTVTTIVVKKRIGSAKGAVEAVDKTTRTLTVSGKQMVVVEKAVIVIGKEKSNLEDIAEGDKVEARGFMKDGILQALSVKVKREADVIKGEVALIDLDTDTLVVDDKDVLVTGETNIRLNGDEAALEDVIIGDKVVVTGKKAEDVFTAKVISIHREPVEMKGAIEYVDIEANTVTIDGKVLLVNEKTIIESDDQEIALADLVEGDITEVKAWQTSETEWVAIKIKVEATEEEEDENENELDKIEGKVEAVDATTLTLTVNGKNVQASETTEISGEGHKTVAFGDIVVGAEVKVEGSWEDDVLVATKIKVEEEDDDDDDEEDKN